MSDALLLGSLRQRVLKEVQRVVPPGPIALLDFPNYGNPGDSAIWLGTLSCLATLGYAGPVYTSDSRSFDERRLQRMLSHGGTILLSGGGNLGDLWPGAQHFRERVLLGFPEHRVVQLAQTIHFSDPAARSSARAAFRTHRDFTILVRDTRSLEIARTELECRAALCPDLAFCLTTETEPALRLPRRFERRDETLYLLRADHERMDSAFPTEVLGAVDWTRDVRSTRNRIADVAEILQRVTDRYPTPAVIGLLARRLVSACYPGLARQRLRRGCTLLTSGGVVVTDRLHGHILGLLLGVPHVVIGDRNGKLRDFIDAWTSSASLMRWAENLSQATRLASELAASLEESPCGLVSSPWI